MHFLPSLLQRNRDLGLDLNFIQKKIISFEKEAVGLLNTLSLLPLKQDLMHRREFQAKQPHRVWVTLGAPAAPQLHTHLAQDGTSPSVRGSGRSTREGASRAAGSPAQPGLSSGIAPAKAPHAQGLQESLPGGSYPPNPRLSACPSSSSSSSVVSARRPPTGILPPTALWVLRCHPWVPLPRLQINPNRAAESRAARAALRVVPRRVFISFPDAASLCSGAERVQAGLSVQPRVTSV